MPFCELYFKQNKNEITTILINEVMRKKQVKKSYSAPACTIIQVNEATDFMQTSMPGQHNPAHHGHGPSSAKAATMWQEEEEDEQNSPSWND